MMRGFICKFVHQEVMCQGPNYISNIALSAKSFCPHQVNEVNYWQLSVLWGVTPSQSSQS